MFHLFFFCPPRGVEWSVSTAWTGSQVFSSLSLQFEESHSQEVCMRLWGGLSVEILADLIQELPRHFLFIFLFIFKP